MKSHKQTSDLIQTDPKHFCLGIQENRARNNVLEHLLSFIRASYNPATESRYRD